LAALHSCALTSTRRWRAFAFRCLSSRIPRARVQRKGRAQRPDAASASPSGRSGRALSAKARV
jgi:hypothetical protein